ncbi:response regulator [Christiangramia crocea]|uniref:Response regulator n=1 Tax=Christiangramia crocea TaxID=2904124 RepID=A0A9X2A7H6_9FLAO|nr:response regulator [Gramella crocea]MCG9973319.1 response regulator [Gramella crocea]
MEKVYLVDDQPIANFITRKLLELEGYKGSINEFTDPQKALEVIKGDDDALIFLDLNMPVMNGWEFLEELKIEGKNYKIIILTSSTSKIDRDKAQDHPCVIKYMVKPMTKDKFKKISKLIEVKVEDNS